MSATLSERQDSKPSLGARVSAQGMLLFTGFAAAQLASFGRNAIIGHWLSKGDFGIAATITLLLQLVETTSELGVDRLIIQSRNGDRPRFVGCCHLVLFLRGVLTALALYVLAGPVAVFFAIPEARWAFEAVAVVPLIKGLLHLDVRRYQRRLSNIAQVTVEVLPQLFALALTVPVLKMTSGYEAIVWLALAQAALMVFVSHLLARRCYQVVLDWAYVGQIFRFGWPIWLSALPLLIVHQGDRALVGRLLGMEELAAFSVAFLITMVPSLVVSRIAHALMLPLLSQVKDQGHEFGRRFRMMTDLAGVVVAAYVALFVAVGGLIVSFAFGSKYAGLDLVVALMAVMWGARMMQAVPGMALLAEANTRPFFTAGLIRATGLAGGYFALRAGWGLEGLVIAGIVAEFASLSYVIFCVKGVGSVVAARASAAVAVAGTLGVLYHGATTDLVGSWMILSLVGGLAVAVFSAGLISLVSPDLRRLVMQLGGSWGTVAG